MKKTSNILLLSNDITIKETIKSSFCGHHVYDDAKYIDCDVDLIILDDYDLDRQDIAVFSNKIVNISQERMPGAINIERPFSINDLLSNIKDFLLKKDKVLKFKNFNINDGCLYIDGKEVKFGSKEILLIKCLYKNKRLSRDVLLNEVWGFTPDAETKVLENTVNNIRKKFKELNINNFIIVDGGLYSILDEFY